MSDINIHNSPDISKKISDFESHLAEYQKLISFYGNARTQAVIRLLARMIMFSMLIYVLLLNEVEDASAVVTLLGLSIIPMVIAKWGEAKVQYFFCESGINAVLNDSIFMYDGYCCTKKYDVSRTSEADFVLRLGRFSFHITEDEAHALATNPPDTLCVQGRYFARIADALSL